MPANKRRLRNGNGNLSSSSSTQANVKSLNPITKIFNNLNGFANGSNFNGYHPVILNHQINSSTSSSSTITTTTVPTNQTVTVNGGTGGTIFTAKQQQQLDRNAFLLTLTKDQLKVECRKRGQKTTGTKTELVRIEIRVSFFFDGFSMFFARLANIFISKNSLYRFLCSFLCLSAFDFIIN